MEYVVLITLGLAMYLVVAYLCWRNVSLSMPYRAVFALSVFPLFALSMVFNIWVVDQKAPFMFEVLDSAKRIGKPDIEAAVGFAIATPLAVLISAFWYFVLAKVERVSSRQGA